MISSKTIKRIINTAINTEGKITLCPDILMAILAAYSRRRIHNAREDL